MEQKTVIITGGNRGIGLSITESFVNDGYSVIVGARHEAGLGDRFGARVSFVPADVRNERDHKALVQLALDRTGRLDVYVNNAGFSAWRPLSDVDETFISEMLDTNLKGTFWGCKAALNALSKGGSIINISSIAGKRGSANNSVYCASKFGVNGLTQALAKEVGARGIRVNAVCPVLIPTQGLIDALKGGSSPAKGNPEEFIAAFAVENAALKRLPTGAEVAAACVFLASGAASAITGQCINVDCGVFPQ